MNIIVHTMFYFTSKRTQMLKCKSVKLAKNVSIALFWEHIVTLAMACFTPCNRFMKILCTNIDGLFSFNFTALKMEHLNKLRITSLPTNIQSTNNSIINTTTKIKQNHVVNACTLFWFAANKFVYAFLLSLASIHFPIICIWNALMLNGLSAIWGI